MPIDTKNRDKLIDALAQHLNTHDKRYMFLKMSFPKLISSIQLEGSAHDTAWNIYTAFDKQQMLGSLASSVMAHLDDTLEIKFKI